MARPEIQGSLKFNNLPQERKPDLRIEKMEHIYSWPVQQRQSEQLRIWYIFFLLPEWLYLRFLKRVNDSAVSQTW